MKQKTLTWTHLGGFNYYFCVYLRLLKQYAFQNIFDTHFRILLIRIPEYYKYAFQNIINTHSRIL